ncbi:hypothetical protein TcWFU_004567 [Taenia crassiceps]|uniref:Uncharacterized protein n=1 Tax=Taenia crassiceps TaxID=6207 RepID=A0ABR4QQH7_9CEST
MGIIRLMATKVMEITVIRKDMVMATFHQLGDLAQTETTVLVLISSPMVVDPCVEVLGYWGVGVPVVPAGSLDAAWKLAGAV